MANLNIGISNIAAINMPMDEDTFMTDVDPTTPTLPAQQQGRRETLVKFIDYAERRRKAEKTHRYEWDSKYAHGDVWSERKLFERKREENDRRNKALNAEIERRRRWDHGESKRMGRDGEASEQKLAKRPRREEFWPRGESPRGRRPRTSWYARGRSRSTSRDYRRYRHRSESPNERLRGRSRSRSRRDNSGKNIDRYRPSSKREIFTPGSGRIDRYRPSLRSNSLSMRFHRSTTSSRFDTEYTRHKSGYQNSRPHRVQSASPPRKEAETIESGVGSLSIAVKVPEFKAFIESQVPNATVSWDACTKMWNVDRESKENVDEILAGLEGKFAGLQLEFMNE